MKDKHGHVVIYTVSCKRNSKSLSEHGKTRANKSRLGFDLLLIGWETGANLASHSYRVAIPKWRQNYSEHSIENCPNTNFWAIQPSRRNRSHYCYLRLYVFFGFFFFCRRGTAWNGRSVLRQYRLFCVSPWYWYLGRSSRHGSFQSGTFLGTVSLWHWTNRKANNDRYVVTEGGGGGGGWR